MSKQYITRKGTADIMHRVMDERFKCANIHGHMISYELTFEFEQSEDIGYAIDFKELKRVACQWIEDYFDHGALLNPLDTILVNAAKAVKSKMWCMSLNGKNNYCNPSIENEAKELFLAIDELFTTNKLIKLHQIRLYETPNCFTDCYRTSITETEKNNFLAVHKDELAKYREEKGVVEYDERKLKQDV